MTVPARRTTSGWGAAAVRRWWEDSPRRWPTSGLWSLIWLSAVLYVPAFDPTSGPVPYLVGAAIIVIFVPFYLAVNLRPGPFRRWSPAFATVLALVTFPLDAGSSILLVYAAGFAGSHRPRRVAVWWLAGLSVLVVALTVVSTIPLPWRFWTFGPTLVLIWVIGMITVEAADEERRAARRHAQVQHLATLSERERISRDLHDLLGQTLTGIVVRAQLAQRLARVDAEAGLAEMAEVERIARQALAEVRATVSGWRQVDLGDEVTVARDALAAAGVTLTVARDPGIALSPSAETALGLALREAVTNVVRHAGARSCTVALRRTDRRIVLEVTDDGVGGDALDGNGLTGMRERIAALGGEVQRRTRDGSALTVAVPAVVSG